MRYLIDQRTGQIRGTFEYGWDFDLDNNIDYLAFRFDEKRRMPSPAEEGTQLYVEFANVVVPNQIPLLQWGWVSFNDFDGFRITGELDMTYEEETLVEIAQRTGPLFGVYDEGSDLIKDDEILEPANCWYDAARMMNLAVRAQAYLAGRGDAFSLNDEIYFILHTGRNDEDIYWEAVSFYPESLVSPYYEMLELSAEEQERLFLPASDTAFPGMTMIPVWGESTLPQRDKSLRVKLIPDSLAGQTVPVGYAAFSHMVGNPETKDIAEALLTQMVRALVLLHTHRIYHELSDGFFGAAFNNLLERLWYDFAVDAALGKLGVCEHCGRVFKAEAERKDKKRFCSTFCQEYEKSARQYRRRKIRKAIEEEDTDDILYLLHVLDDRKITREMVEEVLAQIP